MCQHSYHEKAVHEIKKNISPEANVNRGDKRKTPSLKEQRSLRDLYEVNLGNNRQIMTVMTVHSGQAGSNNGYSCAFFTFQFAIQVLWGRSVIAAMPVLTSII